MKGTLGEGSLSGEPERLGFWEILNALWTGLPLHRGPVGESVGGSFAGTFEEIKRQVYPGSFLDAGVIMIEVWRPSY